jgi:uncharacterized protein (TIGR02453 family)
MGFDGFSKQTVRFLAGLRAHNDRDWFEAHRGDYAEAYLAPAIAFAEALAPRLRKIEPDVSVEPRVNGSILRINRDIRFAKDKSPYKTNIGASFPWVGDDGGDVTGRSRTENVHSSGGYFHLSPGEIYVGGGYWHPERPWIDAFRQRVVADPAAFRAIVDAPAFEATFGGLSRDGHVLQRVPAGYNSDDPEAETLKLKDVVFGRRLSDAEAHSVDLPDVIADTFAAGVPLLYYLASM